MYRQPQRTFDMHAKRFGLRVGVRFTLIELLVVVAIIAVLASLLLPALSKAREKSRTVTCLAQEKQIGMAFLMYADDNGNMLPYPSQTCLAKPAPTYPTGVYVWYSNLYAGAYLGNSTSGTSSISGGLTVSTDVLICPARGDLRARMHDPTWPPATMFNAYGINNYSDPVNNYYKLNLPLSQFAFAERTVMLLDTVNKREWVSWANADITDDRPAFVRHGNLCNAVFADGHAAGVSPRLTDKPDATYKAR